MLADVRDGARTERDPPSRGSALVEKMSCRMKKSDIRRHYERTGQYTRKLEITLIQIALLINIILLIKVVVIQYRSINEIASTWCTLHRGSFIC